MWQLPSSATVRARLPAEPVFGVEPVPLVERLGAHVDAVAQRVLATFCTEIPFYASLPPEEQNRVLGLCREHVRFFLRGLPGRQLPTEEELQPIRLGAARRAEEHVPLEALLASYQVGIAVMWEVLREHATVAEQGLLVDMASWALAYLNALTLTGAAAYVEERQSIYGDERYALRSLAEALLAGNPATAAATRSGHHLAPGYTVLALRFGEPEGGDPASASVMARRRVSGVEALLDERHGPGVLSLLLPGGGTVLLPGRAGDGGAAMADPAGLVGTLVDVAGPETSAAVAWRPGLDGVPAASREADEVLRLAAALGRPPGLQRIDDLLFEYAVTCPSESTERLLQSVIAPLSDGPDLLATLEQWFAADFDRRRTAAVLNVHPNTLDYRLQRVHALTGVDPASARGIQLLGAAMVARRLAQSQ